MGGDDLIQVRADVIPADGPARIFANGGKGFDMLEFELYLLSFPVTNYQGHVLDLGDPSQNTGLFDSATIRKFEAYQGRDYGTVPISAPGPVPGPFVVPPVGRLTDVLHARLKVPSDDHVIDVVNPKAA